MASNVASNPYQARRPATEALALLTYAPTDASDAAKASRKTVLSAAHASQHPESLIGTLDTDPLFLAYHNIHKSRKTGQTTLPGIIAACQAAKACKLFALAFHDMKTDIDATEVVRIDGEGAVGGGMDRNLYKQRFLLKKIVGGRTIEVDSTDSTLKHVIAFRDMDPTSERRYSVTVAVAARHPQGWLCIPLCLDDAVRMFSGHDTKSSLFHIDDMRIRATNDFVVKTEMDDEVDEEQYAGMYTSCEKAYDVVSLSVRVYKSKLGPFKDTVREEDGTYCRFVFATSKSSCGSLGSMFFRFKATSFEQFCGLLGYTDPTFVARCRTGPDPADDCYIPFSHTVQALTGTTDAKRSSKIDPSNIISNGRRRRSGERGDLKSYVASEGSSHVTNRGRLKRSAAAWATIKAEEDENNAKRRALGKPEERDNRICHDSASEAEDELEDTGELDEKSDRRRRSPTPQEEEAERHLALTMRSSPEP